MPSKIKNHNPITEGSLYPSFVEYFLPMFLGSLIQQSYSFIDALIIGNFAGTGALAAIDAPYAYIKLLINAFIALSMGGTIIVSQYYGAKNKEELSNIISSLIRFSVVGGIIITLIGIILAPFFIKTMLIPEDIYHLSLSYLRVYFGGTIFVFTFNISSGILRALGDSKRPFYYLMTSSILNIILDLLFVAVFKWSVAGAALATVLAQGVALVLVLRNIQKRGYHFKKVKSNAALFKALKLGFPMALRSILFAIANMFMQRGINSFGTIYIAGWSICGKAEFMIWSFADTLGIAVTTFVAQNFGARNRDRMLQSVRVGLVTAAVSIGLISVVLYTFIEPIAGWISGDDIVIQSAVYLMRLIAPFYTLYAFGEVFAGGIKGRGNTFYPMLITLIGTGAFRIVWIQIVSAKFMDIKNVILGYPWSWFVTALLMAIYYIATVHLGKSKDIQRIETSAE